MSAVAAASRRQTQRLVPVRNSRAAEACQDAAMTIDTLEYVKKLEAAGIDRKLAEAQAEALRDAIEDRLATKQDLTELDMRLAKYMVAQTAGTVGLVLALGGVLMRLYMP
jgi:hypothetical protein